VVLPEVKIGDQRIIQHIQFFLVIIFFKMQTQHTDTVYLVEVVVMVALLQAVMVQTEVIELMVVTEAAVV
tara:strand:- start:178 stop:387 length:210 start_codon:yes stop_codon:yes gene_type:complete